MLFFGNIAPPPLAIVKIGTIMVAFGIRLGETPGVSPGDVLGEKSIAPRGNFASGAELEV